MSINTLKRTILQTLINPTISHAEAAVNYNLGINKLIYSICFYFFGEQANKFFPDMKLRVESIDEFVMEIEDARSKNKFSLIPINAIYFKFENEAYSLKNSDDVYGIHLININNPDVKFWSLK